MDDGIMLYFLDRFSLTKGNLQEMKVPMGLLLLKFIGLGCGVTKPLHVQQRLYTLQLQWWRANISREVNGMPTTKQILAGASWVLFEMPLVQRVELYSTALLTCLAYHQRRVSGIVLRMYMQASSHTYSYSSADKQYNSKTLIKNKVLLESGFVTSVN